MDLRPYVENIQRQVAVAADAGGDDARQLAERLMAPLDAAIQLTLQDALAAAAEQITTELAPGSVELRLRGRDLELVVTPPPPDSSSDGRDGPDGPRESDRTAAAAPPGTSVPPADSDDGGMSRINLRLPDSLKTRIEAAAGGDGLSVNAWLVRALAAAVERANYFPRSERRAPQGGQHYTGWAR